MEFGKDMKLKIMDVGSNICLLLHVYFQDKVNGHPSTVTCNTLVALACAMNVEPTDSVALTMVMVHYRAHCMKPYSARPNVPYYIFVLLGTYCL